jgi:hypothetical protein
MIETPEIHYLWDRQILVPVQQPKLQFQHEDVKRASHCPVYSKACKEAWYLAPTGAIDIHWHGTNNYELDYPKEWSESCAKAKAKWVQYAASNGATKDPTDVRSHAVEPLGSPHGGHMAFQGGLMLNFFFGMCIKTPLGVKTLVTAPINKYNSAWTIQTGIYDTDIWTGDFSINLQIMRQEPIKIEVLQPIASLMFVTLNDQEVAEIPPDDPRAEGIYEEAAEYYLAKNESRCPYHRVLDLLKLRKKD